MYNMPLYTRDRVTVLYLPPKFLSYSARLENALRSICLWTIFSEVNLKRDTIEAFSLSKESSFNFIKLLYLCKALDILLQPRACKIEFSHQIDPNCLQIKHQMWKIPMYADYPNQVYILSCPVVSEKKPISCFSFGCFWFLFQDSFPRVEETSFFFTWLGALEWSWKQIFVWTQCIFQLFRKVTYSIIFVNKEYLFLYSK